jgi:hypothetical protein
MAYLPPDGAGAAVAAPDLPLLELPLLELPPMEKMNFPSRSSMLIADCVTAKDCPGASMVFDPPGEIAT